MNSLDEIINLGARYYGVTQEELKGPKRGEPLVLYRFSTMLVARERGFKFTAIGNAFNRDHGTVMYACKCMCEEKAGVQVWERHKMLMAIVSGTPLETPNPLASILAAMESQLFEMNRRIDILVASRDQILDLIARAKATTIL